MIRAIKKLLIHKAVYKEISSLDEYQNKIYKDDITLKNIRIETKTTIQKNSDGKQEIKSIKLFYYPEMSTPKINFVLGSLISFDGQTYTIIDVQKFSNITNNNVFSCEVTGI